MIEIVFSQSAYGSLKFAQQYYWKKHSVCIVDSVLASRHESSRKELKTSEKEADAYCIDVLWSIGDISDDGIGSLRRRVLEQATFADSYGENADQCIDKRLQTALNALQIIQKRVADGEPLRIWYSHNPDEICGFCWLLAQLQEKNVHGSIYSVRLPDWEYSRNGTLCTHIGWGEISPEDWKKHLALQQEVKPVLLTACAMRWKQLQKENAPLRIYLNGRLQSAPEDIYDSFILQAVDAQSDEFSEAELIGSVVGKYQLGIGDTWIALRIEQFIKQGMLDIVTSLPADGMNYRRILRKRHAYR